MGKTARSMLCVFAATAGLLACGSPPPPKSVEMVPANSANEPEKKDDATTTSGTAGDSSGASGAVGGGVGASAGGGGSGKPSGGGNTANGGMPQRIGGETTSAGSTTPTSPAAGSGAGTTVPAAAGPKVTKAECKKVLDRYVDLAIAADPNLAGLPPDVIKQAFAQAASQSANPCEGDGVSRNQYKCAMKATSADAWQTCMK